MNRPELISSPDGGHVLQQSNKNIHKSIEITIWIVLGIFFVTPLFLITYYQDDRVFVLISEFSTLNPFDSALNEIKGWLNDGRFIPFSVFVRYIFFDIFGYNNSWLYHLTILLFSGGAFFTFLKLIRVYQFKGSAFLFFLFFIALTQFRVSAPDPIVGYNALVQINTIIVCWALIFIELYFQSTRIRYFLLGALLAFISVLYYEISVVILAAPIVVYLYKYQFKEFQKQFILYSLFYVSLLLLFIVFRIYFKELSETSKLDLYPGTELGFDLKKILFGLFFQVSGSLPLSYIAHLFERLFHTYLITYAILITACVFVYFKRAKIASLDRRFLLLSVFIIFSAALPVALSNHHSSWVSFGYPYIPVFMQNLALASILAALVSNTKAVRALLFVMIFASSAPNYVLFHELNKKDGSVRLVFDMFGLQDYPMKTQFDKTYIIDGNDFGMDVKFVESKAREELGEIHYANINEPIFAKGTTSNAIVLSKSNYKNAMAVVGQVDEAHKISNPVYMSPSRACIEQVASNKDKIFSYKTHRESMIYTYSDSGQYNFDDRLSCKLHSNWYDNLMDKFVPKY